MVKFHNILCVKTEETESSHNGAKWIGKTNSVFETTETTGQQKVENHLF